MPKKYKLLEGKVTYLREKKEKDLRRENRNERAEISEVI